MQIIQNDTKMNILFCKETKHLLKAIKKQIKTNKLDKYNMLISLHNLKAIALLFELTVATRFVFELESYIFDLNPSTLTNREWGRISQLYLQIKMQFKRQQKKLKSNLDLYKSLHKFNNTLNKNANNGDICLSLHTKMDNKLKPKAQKHIVKILFELIKNSHAHGFANTNIHNKTINIKVFYKHNKIIIFYKDNGKCDKKDMFMNSSTKEHKDILCGFGVGSKLISKYAKKLKINIYKIDHFAGFKVVLR